jgi:hypothetical protein
MASTARSLYVDPSRESGHFTALSDAWLGRYEESDRIASRTVASLRILNRMRLPLAPSRDVARLFWGAVLVVVISAIGLVAVIAVSLGGVL